MLPRRSWAGDKLSPFRALSRKSLFKHRPGASLAGTEFDDAKYDGVEPQGLDGTRLSLDGTPSTTSVLEAETIAESPTTPVSDSYERVGKMVSWMPDTPTSVIDDDIKAVPAAANIEEAPPTLFDTETIAAAIEEVEPVIFDSQTIAADIEEVASTIFEQEAITSRKTVIKRLEPTFAGIKPNSGGSVSSVNTTSAAMLTAYADPTGNVEQRMPRRRAVPLVLIAIIALTVALTVAVMKPKFADGPVAARTAAQSAEHSRKALGVNTRNALFGAVPITAIPIVLHIARAASHVPGATGLVAAAGGGSPIGLIATGVGAVAVAVVKTSPTASVAIPAAKYVAAPVLVKLVKAVSVPAFGGVGMAIGFFTSLLL